MATGSFRRLAREIMQELGNLRLEEKSLVKEWTRLRSDAGRASYIRALARQSWDDLARQARERLRACRDRLREQTQRQERIAALYEKRALLDASIKTSALSLSRRQDWPVLRGRLEEALQKRGKPPERVAETLAAVESWSEDKLSSFLDKAVAGATDRLNSLAEKNVAAQMGAVLALAVARFNQHFDGKVTPSLAPESFLSQTEAALDKAERRPWKALGAADLQEALVVATELKHLAASWLMEGALPQAAALAATRRGSSSQNGQLALRCGDLIRALLRAIALGHYLAWLAGWPPSASPTRDWVRAASRLPFSRKAGPPRPVALSSLADRSGRWNGKAVTIEGVLGQVLIAHQGRVTISSAAVSNGTGASVTIAIPFMKLDSGGMVPGAYVRVSGIWHDQAREVNGPALRIDRLNLRELGRQNWRDWATGQLRRTFEAVPHGLAASWSWEAGLDGAGNQLRYGTWFTRTKGGR